MQYVPDLSMQGRKSRLKNMLYYKWLEHKKIYIIHFPDSIYSHKAYA